MLLICPQSDAPHVAAFVGAPCLSSSCCLTTAHCADQARKLHGVPWSRRCFGKAVRSLGPLELVARSTDQSMAAVLAPQRQVVGEGLPYHASVRIARGPDLGTCHAECGEPRLTRDQAPRRASREGAGDAVKEAHMSSVEGEWWACRNWIDAMLDCTCACEEGAYVFMYVAAAARQAGVHPARPRHGSEAVSQCGKAGSTRNTCRDTEYLG